MILYNKTSMVWASINLNQLPKPDWLWTDAASLTMKIMCVRILELDSFEWYCVKTDQTQSFDQRIVFAVCGPSPSAALRSQNLTPSLFKRMFQH